MTARAFVLAAATTAFAWLACAASAVAQDTRPIPSMYADPAPFLRAIEQERQAPPERAITVTGITVPHHLLAADLMARGFWATAGRRYDRVVILSPDHFNRARKPFATTRRDFDTVLGRLATDRDAVDALLVEPDLFEASDLFEAEHGVAALLPFVKHFWPDARIVPVAISIRAGRGDWDRAEARLHPLVGPDTLVVQSTDYSHYLPLAESLARDQETLHVLAAEDPEAIETLRASDHMDSRGAQYIQMRLQAARGSRLTVVASRNSVEYVPHASRTTSYLVGVYAPEVEAFPFRYPDQDVLLFAGDTYPGRFLTKPLADERVAAALVEQVRVLTGGAPLVVNVEAAILAEPPEGTGEHIHAAHASLALPLLRRLNVKAASLANNHAFDLGRDGFSETVRQLQGAGIAPIAHESVVDLGLVRVLALNFVGRNDRAGFPVVREGDLDRVCRTEARPPFVALVHWGTEYVTGLGDAEHAAARELARCGISAVIGAHSHRASTRIEAQEGGASAILPSLGNFLFDQTSPRGSGTLLELRRFRQGTYALRLIPLPNLFDLANGIFRAGRP